ncbi:ComEA family DNA-binding protein [Corynebacterium sp. 335C]
MNDTLRSRIGDLLAPVPADESMPVDFTRRRWRPGRRAVIAMGSVGFLVVLALAVWWLRTPTLQMPEPGQPVVAAAADGMGPGDIAGGRGGAAVGGAGGVGAAAGGGSGAAGGAGGPDGAAGAGPAGGGAAGEQPSEIVVSVVGLVRHPGVVTLPGGARVADALAAAGGMLPEADPASVNHARRLADGEQILVTDVPAPPGSPDAAGAPAGAGGAAGAAGAGGAGGAGGAAGGLVNLNTADEAALDQLPGVGPSTAQKIIAHRDANGPFGAVEELMEVSGIGPAKFESLKDLVTV